MRLIFIRHGDPDYKQDCLTALGHRQAEAAADRLQNEKIDGFFSSTCGRAMETAEHIASRFGKEIQKLEFLREIRWGSMDEEPLKLNGHPWFTVDDMVAAGQEIRSWDWEQTPPFNRNKVVTNIHRIQEQTDLWLKSLGYVREGTYYRTMERNDQTYLVAGHGGSSIAAMAHILGLPFPFACKIIRPEVTGITVLYFPDEPEALVCPEIELMNDARHIEGLESANIYGN